MGRAGRMRPDNGQGKQGRDEAADAGRGWMRTDGGGLQTEEAGRGRPIPDSMGRGRYDGADSDSRLRTPRMR
jgi:hypothetical protein